MKISLIGIKLLLSTRRVVGKHLWCEW